MERTILTWKDLMKEIERIITDDSNHVSASLDVSISGSSAELMIIGFARDETGPQLKAGYVGNELYLIDLYNYMRKEVNPTDKDKPVIITFAESKLALTSVGFLKNEKFDEWIVGLHTERI